MNRKITVAIAGLGSRGRDSYAKVVKQLPEQAKIVAVADIDAKKVEEMRNEFQIPAENCFSSAEEMLKQEKLADVMFICTQDKQHVGHGMAALGKGYDLLLEKPVSPDLEECRRLEAKARECKRKVVVCHVLRYTPFYNVLKEILDSGVIGDVITVQAIENVGYYHQAHSFVRGNWRSKEQTSPMILQKCCHDMDILLWLTGKHCKSVSSFGSLSYFKKENAPAGAAKRCLDGCKAKKTCPYDAEKIYITGEFGVANGNASWPNNVLTLHPTVETVTEALKTGPYGRCVFECDNDVVDHQVVNLLMEDGSTVNFTMSAFTSVQYRYTKLMGTMGDIQADLDKKEIIVTPFGQEPQVIDVNKKKKATSGHSGGDEGIVREFLSYIADDSKKPKNITSIEDSLESHYICMAAEKSRIEGGQCIELKEMTR